MKHTQKTLRRGGIRIINSFTSTTAIKYFLANSSYKLFSKSGVSGIQILATLRPDKQSPYKTIRTNAFNIEVKQILLKLFTVGNKHGYSGDYRITLPEEIDRETKVQQDLYKKSYTSENSLLEPICPCIVFAHYNPINNSIKQAILNNINDDDNDNIGIVKEFLDGNIGFIAMELMEGYKTLESLKSHSKYELYKLMALYELNNMHKFGYLHNDFHFENVLINETYNYFDTTGNGRAIIIDFGQSDRVDDDNASDLRQLLNNEIGTTPDNIFEIFNMFDKGRLAVQQIYISGFESQLNKSVRDIMSMFIFYNGGSPMTTKKGNAHVKHDWNLPSDDELTHIMSDFFADGLKSNQDAYQKFNDSVNSVKKMEPTYFDELLRSQMTGLISNTHKRKSRKL